MESKKIYAYIGLGSNIEPRQTYLDRAIEMLRNSREMEVTAVSSYINTKPVGYLEQPDFLNAVAEIKTGLEPGELLLLCNNIEQELRRKREIKWGPRTIDLDILLYGNLVIDSKNLTVPHTHMCYREFVLKPLSEIAPSVVHPVFRKTIGEIYDDFLKGIYVKEVTAAIIRNGNKILICQRAPDDECGMMWEFPGGKREPGETPEECITREIKEELGIDILVKDIFTRSIYRINDKDVYFTVFNAEIRDMDIKSNSEKCCENNETKIELNVHNDARWVEIHELAGFNFMPADIEFVEKLLKSHRGQ